MSFLTSIPPSAISRSKSRGYSNGGSIRAIIRAATACLFISAQPLAAQNSQDKTGEEAEVEETSNSEISSESEDSLELPEFTVSEESETKQLRGSAQAVHVIETEVARQLTADLGEVLARSQGVGVQRSGGLGSEARFSLNGLTDDQIRFFLDGIPLEMSGYPFGISNVPVNQIEHIEIYRGVVPVKFGADALGGAVNLVTDNDVVGTHGSASYQLGSYGTHRLTLGMRHLHEPSGFFTRFSGFYDRSDNDYPIDVKAPDERGRLHPVTVDRFHDAYQAGGGNIELGVVDKPWAERLLMRAFVTEYSKDLQHNVVMTVPYGEVEYGELAKGASLRYENSFNDKLSVDAIAGYSKTTTDFVDVGEYVYDWFGHQVYERPQPGEIESDPTDQVIWEDSTFVRTNLRWLLDSGHQLQFSLAPTWISRTGDERSQTDPDTRDPLTAQRDVFTVIMGLEHKSSFLNDRFENIFFVKDYLQTVRSEEPVAGGIFTEKDRNTHRQGIGNGLRYRINSWLYAKASYEYATRLPRPDEIFGNAILIIDNLELKPETSHNLNLGFTIDGFETESGSWRADLNAFLREADQLIVLLGNDQVFSYQNVFAARSTGIEASGGWTSDEGFFKFDGNFTYLDFRNTSDGGTFGNFKGDRIPNRPYLFANSSIQLQWFDVVADYDDLSLALNTRYMHEFFRGWESVGLREFKQTVDSQLTHALALAYRHERDSSTLGMTAEIQNLSDEKVYDFFGVQRPGRTFNLKLTLDF